MPRRWRRLRWALRADEGASIGEKGNDGRGDRLSTRRPRTPMVATLLFEGELLPGDGPGWSTRRSRLLGPSMETLSKALPDSRDDPTGQPSQTVISSRGPG